jgi:predicted DNA-binding protein with PD1-like motif
VKSASSPQGWLIRLDPGDEIPRDVLAQASELGVQTALVAGIGAIDRAVIALYDLKERRYIETVLEEELELAALQGNLTRVDGAPFLHAHVVLTRRDGQALGGHLMSARISVTVELALTPMAIEATRTLSPHCGLKLLEF